MLSRRCRSARSTVGCCRRRFKETTETVRWRRQRGFGGKDSATFVRRSNVMMSDGNRGPAGCEWGPSAWHLPWWCTDVYRNTKSDAIVYFEEVSPQRSMDGPTDQCCWPLFDIALRCEFLTHCCNRGWQLRCGRVEKMTTVFGSYDGRCRLVVLPYTEALVSEFFAGFVSSLDGLYPISRVPPGPW